MNHQALAACGGAGRAESLFQRREGLCTAQMPDKEPRTVLLSEKPLAEDPDHGESAGHEPFQEALCLGAAGWAHG